MKKKTISTICVFILLLIIISIITYIYKYTYISLALSIISFILSIFLSKRNRIIFIFIFAICTTFITLNLIKLYNNYIYNQDIYEDKNLLLGSWIYNEYNGKYIFNDNYTYTQYSNESTDDNYCIGTYEYNYGVTSKSGLFLTQDKNYYYYTLFLKEEYCIIMDKKFNDNFTKTIYFALDKANEEINEFIFINKDTENMFSLKKVN